MLLLVAHDQLGFLFATRLDIPVHSGLAEDVQANGVRRGNGSLAEGHVNAEPDGDKLEEDSELYFV